MARKSSVPRRARRPSRPRRPSLIVRLTTVVGKALRRHAADLAGLSLVLAGLLAALGVYADLAGPAGRAVRDGADAALGLGRFLVPAGLCLIGGVLLRGRPPEEPTGVAIGVALLVVSVCGLLSVTAAAGGALGRGVGDPLHDLLAGWGAGLVLGTTALLSLLLATRTPLRGVPPLVARLWRWLLPEPDVDSDAEPEPEAELDTEPEPDVVPESEPEPAAGHEAPAVQVHVPGNKGEQLAIELGPAAEPGAWKLPSLGLLKRGKAQQIDTRLVEAAGRTLEQALATHGVETRLVGMTVGPTVTRYELALAPGVKVA